MHQNNKRIYDRLARTPKEARKAIGGGRLKGKTDINPMWRIQALTDLFGPCGKGWKIEVVKMWLEEGFDNQKSAFVSINLFYKEEGDENWSAPIFGIGGNMFVEKERSGLFQNDECFKMAYTDGISVACKALGMSSDIYYENDTSSKYNIAADKPAAVAPKPISEAPFDDKRKEAALGFLAKIGVVVTDGIVSSSQIKELNLVDEIMEQARKAVKGLGLKVV
jgi:hypothetical protein